MSEESAAESCLQPVASRQFGYRDELNFAEFPLASLSDTVPHGQKTLVFSDKIFDRGRNEPVTRKLTITASDEYGLPTALDDEVILGLVQLTAKQKFQDRRVHFTRRELIRELSWRDESKSYARIEESLKRWLGVTLYYDKAWWSKEEQCWVDESFHILEQVTLFDRDRIARRKKSLPDDPKAGLSSFMWNDVVFTSFRTGYIKQLDFDLYKRLRSPIAKRLFRFLDKRFYHRPKLEFELTEFAFEHIGISRNYHTGEIKRRLVPAIAELEQCGFLKTLPQEERFLRHARGKWDVVFIRKEAAKAAPAENGGDGELAQKLVARGVGSKFASSLATQYPQATVEEKLELLDWLCQRGDARVSKNPAGFLVKAIREDYPVPEDYRREKERRKQAVVSDALAATRAQASLVRTNAEEAEVAQFRARVDQFWNSLTEIEQERFEKRAVQSADNFLRAQYLNGKGRGGRLFEAARQALLDREIIKHLAASTGRPQP